MKPPVGRAELVVIAAALGEEALGPAAELLGLEALAPDRSQPEERREPETVGTISKGLAEAPAPSEIARRRVPFWRLVSVEHREPLEAVPAPSEDAALTGEELRGCLGRRGEPMPREPLVAWSRLWPVLGDALASSRLSSEIDAPTLVDRWCRGELTEEIPRQEWRAWPGRLVVIVDRSERLLPFWWDQDEVVRHLAGWICERSVVELSLPDGLLGDVGDDLLDELEGWEAGLAGARVLALSDLGFHESSKHRQRWLRLARRLRRLGCSLTALVPAPPARFDAECARSWNAIPWEEPRRSGAVVAGEVLTIEQRCERAERLLRLVSPLSRVEPGLLRVVRRLLPDEEADCGTEVDACRHPKVRGAHAEAITLDPQQARTWQEELAELPIELREKVLELARAWHASLPREIWLSELWSLHAHVSEGVIEPGEWSEALALARRFEPSLVPEGSQGDERQAIEGFVNRAQSRLPEGSWREDELGRSLQRAWWLLHRGEERERPPGFSRDLVADLGDGARVPSRAWRLGQVGEQLMLARPDDASVDRGWTWLADLAPCSPTAAVITGSSGEDRQVLLEAGPMWPVSPTASVVLETSAASVTLEPWTREDWAVDAGRDRNGLWADVEVAGVRQRLRWVPPGRFLMGSPEEEQGRDGEGSDWNEGPQHEVTLTHGYWLADTPCTQELWEAVMGENPSRFVSPTRPVEQVSWQDVGVFLEKLAGRVPGLHPGLPTEAQWEHACRAGTTTSTYAGEMEILGERNAPLLGDIAWYGGNSGVDYDLEEGESTEGPWWTEMEHEFEKTGTRRVALKSPNPWGLFDTLGNTWEWCADGQRDYEAEAVTDPVGAGQRGSRRVLRGGSWVGGARSCRAATRYAYAPEYRYGNIGFRWSRGQVPGAEPSEHAGEARGDGARRRSRREERR